MKGTKYVKNIYCECGYPIKAVRSKNFEKNHLTVIAEAEGEEDARIIVDEMRKAARRMNRLSKSKISYEILVKHVRAV